MLVVQDGDYEMKNVRERDVERFLVSTVKRMGGICPKWVSPGFDGVPDRILLLPSGRIAFVEVKAPGKCPGPLQVARMRMLQKLGFRVYVLDNVEKIEVILDEILST